MGSSASRISGRLTNARAMATRCCSPPESSCGNRCSLPARPTSSSTSGTACAIACRGLPITSRAKATFSNDGLVRQQAEVLEDHADRAAQVRDLPAGQPGDVLAGDEDRAPGGALLLEHQPQERRLARAGRADEEDELALLDLEADVVQRGPGRPSGRSCVTFSKRITGGVLGRVSGSGRRSVLVADRYGGGTGRPDGSAGFECTQRRGGPHGDDTAARRLRAVLLGRAGASGCRPR